MYKEAPSTLDHLNVYENMQLQSVRQVPVLYPVVLTYSHT